MAERLADNIDELDRATKAAVLLMALDDDTAGRLLRCMPCDMIEDVTRVLASPGEIPAALSLAVLEEFQGLRPRMPQSGRVGQWMARAQPAPFAFLHSVECDRLSACIQYEQPQTIALILSHLPRRQASEVLMHLPSPVQTEAVGLMAQMHEPGEEIIRAVELALESSLAMTMRVAPAVDDGRIENIEDLLDLCDLDRAPADRSNSPCPS